MGLAGGPRYPGGEPISLAISWLCWNSAQSILMQARGSPKSDSATVSTTLVFPEPVGPKNKGSLRDVPGIQTGQKQSGSSRMTFPMASFWPTIFRRKKLQIPGHHATAGGVKRILRTGSQFFFHRPHFLITGSPWEWSLLRLTKQTTDFGAATCCRQMVRHPPFYARTMLLGTLDSGGPERTPPENSHGPA